MECGFKYKRSRCSSCGKMFADNWFIRHMKRAHGSSARRDTLGPRTVNARILVPSKISGRTKRTFLISDEGLGSQVVTGDIETTLAYVKSLLAEMKNEESLELEIRRVDMTEEKIESLGVI